MSRFRVPLFQPERDPSKTYHNWNKRQVQKLELGRKKKMRGVHVCADPKVFDVKCDADVELARIMQGLRRNDEGIHFMSEAMRRQ